MDIMSGSPDTKSAKHLTISIICLFVEKNIYLVQASARWRQ